ncbi:hypothetical protein STXM2123_2714 [Streptomyces sp. F-3]|nr:hypothetical protein STXM2123_2714 [Streptomyces sp. F-3]
MRGEPRDGCHVIGQSGPLGPEEIPSPGVSITSRSTIHDRPHS